MLQSMLQQKVQQKLDSDGAPLLTRPRHRRALGEALGALRHGLEAPRIVPTAGGRPAPGDAGHRPDHRPGGCGRAAGFCLPRFLHRQVIETQAGGPMKSIGFAALFALLAVTGAKADPRDDALSAMLRCSGIADRAQRLACYDTASARAPGALNSAAAEPGAGDGQRRAAAGAGRRAAQEATAAASWTSCSEAAAPSGRRRPRSPSSAARASPMVAATPIPLPWTATGIEPDQRAGGQLSVQPGYVVVSLDNGQVWQQTADGNPIGRLSRPALAYSAVISRGSAGSYDMKLNDVARTLPVRRIQ